MNHFQHKFRCKGFENFHNSGQHSIIIRSSTIFWILSGANSSISLLFIIFTWSVRDDLCPFRCWFRLLFIFSIPVLLVAAQQKFLLTSTGVSMPSSFITYCERHVPRWCEFMLPRAFFVTAPSCAWNYSPEVAHFLNKLLNVMSILGVGYNQHIVECCITHVSPEKKPPFVEVWIELRQAPHTMFVPFPRLVDARNYIFSPLQCPNTHHER